MARGQKASSTLAPRGALSGRQGIPGVPEGRRAKDHSPPRFLHRRPCRGIGSCSDHSSSRKGTSVFLRSNTRQPAETYKTELSRDMIFQRWNQTVTIRSVTDSFDFSSDVASRPSPFFLSICCNAAEIHTKACVMQISHISWPHTGEEHVVQRSGARRRRYRQARG
jgi:hypothetical protein